MHLQPFIRFRNLPCREVKIARSLRAVRAPGPAEVEIKKRHIAVVQTNQQIGGLRRDDILFRILFTHKHQSSKSEKFTNC